MEEALPHQAVPTDPWQIENLIRMSWNRTVDRFVSYFLAVVLGVIVLVAAVVSGLLLGGILVALSAALFPPSVSSVPFILIVVIVSLLAYSTLLYVGSLISLLINQVIIQETKVGVMETFSSIRPLVWGYVWFNFLVSLFLLGLLFWGIISLGVVIILWGIWGTFSTFVYLEKKNKGLEILWLSREIVRQRFWGIVGRLLLLNVAAFFISSLLASSKNSVLEAGLALFSLVTQPFLLSFSYEMYRQIPQPQVVKRPTLWVVLSLVGWVLIILSVVSFGGLAINSLKNYNPTDLQNLYRSVQKEQDIKDFQKYFPGGSNTQEFPGFPPTTTL